IWRPPSTRSTAGGAPAAAKPPAPATSRRSRSTMRSLAIAWLASLAPLGWAQAAAAPLTIEHVQVGFPPAEGARRGNRPTCYKAGAWTPLLVRVRGGENGFAGGKLWVETWDSDDVQNRYPVPLPPLARDETRTIPAFARPGSLGADIVVSAEDSQG